MDKQIRPKGGPALIITFYVSTAALCILAASAARSVLEEKIHMDP